MALVTLTCPFCGLSKQLEESVLPQPGATVTCPSCKGRFPLPAASPDQSPPVTPQPAVIISDAPGAAFARPPYQEAVAQDADPSKGNTPPKEPSTSSDVTSTNKVRDLTFTFTGNAKEYFGIWMVNTLLRIVTLGIYSPWAKVRGRRYFCNNTLLDDAPFDYLADPLAILKGWFIAGLLFAIYSLASRISAVASIALTIVFVVMFPWLLVRARIFTLQNSSHRNIRFSFRPNYRDAYKVYLWWPLLGLLTLGVLWPHVVYRQKRFLAENSSYGTTPFQFEGTRKEYSRIFIRLSILILLGLAVVLGMALVAQRRHWYGLIPFLPLLSLLCVYLGTGLYLPTAVSNLTWNSTRIAGHSFTSTLRVLDLAWFYLSNAVAVICTLGLLTPWASVRLARYRLRKLTLNGVGTLDAFIAAEGESCGAAAEEIGDILGIDIGL
jgi:uncharacterized membrane protein YjgN (DUF898 family)